MTDSNEYVIVSYIPFLEGEAGKFLDLDKDSISNLDNILKDSPSGAADGCLWMSDEGSPYPVFIMERGLDLVEHMKVWSEGELENWFKLSFLEKDGKYAIALSPNLNKSMERWKITFQLKTGFPPPEGKYNFIFQPIFFVSGGSTAFHLVKDKLRDEVYVGFIDSDKVDMENPQNMDPHIFRVGPFTIDEENFKSYLEKVINESIEPGAQSITFNS